MTFPFFLISHMNIIPMLNALILAVEKDLSTGRACQATAREHGLAQ